MRLNLFMSMNSPRNRLTRLLRCLGPSWEVSLIRRSTQMLCLLGYAILLLYVCWPYGASDVAEAFASKEFVNAELFLLLDPLVSISTAIAARMWVWSLPVAGAVLLLSLVFPRAYCGYVCPLGTLLDLFDWAVGKRLSRPGPTKRPLGASIRYFVLASVLLAAVLGVMLAGFAAAIPILTRGMVLALNPVQTGLFKGWYLVPSMNAGHYVSIALLAAIVALCVVERRFWCKYLCPTGAVFSIASLLRLTERKVSALCVNCGQCEKVCDFAAIRADYSTVHTNCSFCQSCGGVCRVGAIEFAGRWTDRTEGFTDRGQTVSLSRRSLITGIGCSLGAGAGLPLAFGRASVGEVPVRPPGSVLETEFLQLCVRCGECIKVCPNNVLQPAGFAGGLNGLWAPKVVADWSGCEPTCNNCGQVCPTGAIRALQLEEKRAARIGLAVVDRQTCLPFSGGRACQLCADECKAAGYDAIEFIRVGVEVDQAGAPIEESGFLAPVVLPERCVGCGLCQMRCRAINVKDKHLLSEASIRVVAGEGHEDRISTGSYVELQRKRQKANGTSPSPKTQDNAYLPDFLR